MEEAAAATSLLICLIRKKNILIGQNVLYAKTPSLCRSGSEPISPIATTIPMMQMFDFVSLNDIYTFF